MKTLERIIELKKTGEFHHATVRVRGQHEYIYIYRKDDNGFNGFEQDCSVSTWDHQAAEYAKCDRVLAGIHVGSYGRG